jgi:hypothetical protein
MISFYDDIGLLFSSDSQVINVYLDNGLNTFSLTTKKNIIKQIIDKNENENNYFYYSNNIFANIKIQEIQQKYTIHINKKYNLYKMIFINICDKPIHYIAVGNQTLTEIICEINKIQNIKIKGNIILDNIILNKNEKICNLNFKNGHCLINYLINEKKDIPKTINLNGYKKRDIDKNNKTILLDDLFKNKDIYGNYIIVIFCAFYMNETGSGMYNNMTINGDVYLEQEKNYKHSYICDWFNVLKNLESVVNYKKVEMLNYNDISILNFLIKLGTYVVLRNDEEIVIDNNSQIGSDFINKYNEYRMTNIDDYILNNHFTTFFIKEYKLEEIILIFQKYGKIILKKCKNSHEYIVNTELINIDLLITKDIAEKLFNNEICEMCKNFIDKNNRTIDAMNMMRGHIINNVQMLCRHCNSHKSRDLLFTEKKLNIIFDKSLIEIMITNFLLKNDAFVLFQENDDLINQVIKKTFLLNKNNCYDWNDIINKIIIKILLLDKNYIYNWGELITKNNDISTVVQNNIILNKRLMESEIFYLYFNFVYESYMSQNTNKMIKNIFNEIFNNNNLPLYIIKFIENMSINIKNKFILRNCLDKKYFMNSLNQTIN